MVARVLLFLFVLLSVCGFAGGYEFMNGTSHTSIRFELFKNLIVIPAKLNDSISLKLILDTGTRSMLLYGKRFASMVNLSAGHRVKVAGWGSPQGVDARVSFPNQIQINRIKGNDLAVAVITSKHLFPDKKEIDGIIGYELFATFVVEINYKTRTIHLYDKLPYGHTEGFTSLPLEVNKTMPQVYSTIVLKDNTTVNMRLLIDTGSSLGLTLFSKNQFAVQSSEVAKTVGFGLNGVIKGFDLYLKHFFLGSMKVRWIQSHIVNVEQHPDETFTFCGSVGAAFLKKHVVIFDYSSSKLFLG